MGSYKVSYTDIDGDLSHIHVEANSIEEAKIVAQQEYWDINQILVVTRL